MKEKATPEVTADMEILGGDTLLAEGTVTLDGIFTVSGVRVRNIKKPDGEETLAVLLPRRRREDGSFEPVFSVTPALKGEINAAVAEDLAKKLGRGLSPEKIEVEITPDISGDLLGDASVTYEGVFTVSGIRILKDKGRDGIRLEFPKSSENGRSSPLFSTEDIFTKNTLTQLISNSYRELMRNPKERMREEEAMAR